MTRQVVRYPRNLAGRDLIIGDIHGYFTKARQALDAVGFDPARDRVFCVGDLVDRGPESDQALDWLDLPWFRCVRGNHEEAAIAWAMGGMDKWHYIAAFSGAWNVMNPPSESLRIADAFAALPLAIELETEGGLVLVAHADCPLTEWGQAHQILEDGGLRADALQASMQWSRDRLKRMFDGPVTDLRAAVVGHNEVERFTSLDNILFIDTGGWHGRSFTILDAATLRPASDPRRSLDWS